MTKDFAVGALEQLAPASLPGLVSEAICYATIAGSASHADAIAAVLRAGAEMLLGPISDPTGFDVLPDDIDDDLLAAAQQAGRGVEYRGHTSGRGACLDEWRGDVDTMWSPCSARGAAATP